MTKRKMQIPESFPQKKKAKRKNTLSVKIDMTPMVDLGFLLITFFIISTQLSEPRAMEIVVPAESNIPTKFADSRTITVLPADGQIFYYEGQWSAALERGGISSLQSTKELRNKIQAKQLLLEKSNLDRQSLSVIIKPLRESNYKMFVDVIDEMVINEVKTYAVAKPDEVELDWVGRK